MNLTNIKFKFTNVESNEQLKSLTESKLSSLDKFIGDAPVIFEVEFERMNTQNSGDIYRVEANIDSEGKLYRAEATLGNFEAALDEVNNELNKELRRANKKNETLFRRGARQVKSWIKFGRD